MDRLEERLETAARAYATLTDILTVDVPPTVRRDAAIIRLVYTFEAVWKAAQRFLAELPAQVAAGASDEHRGEGRVFHVERRPSR